MATYHLRLLGAAVLTAADTPGAEPLLGPGKSLALLTYLALAPRRTVGRELLTDLLWSDTDPESARRNLRQALHQLRRRLGPASVTGDEGDVTLTASITTDRDRFLAAAESGDMAAAATLYTGPFFPAFAAPGGAAFEHWADLERRRLHAAYLHALASLAREDLRHGRWREATANARRLRDADPEGGTGWRLLLEALVSRSDWLSAALEADACETMFRAQGRTPEPALRAALQAARQVPLEADPKGGGRLVAEMVGRQSEFAAIISAWDQARQGRLQRLHLLGAAGIGKSRLLREAAARLSAHQGRVVLVRANQGERDLAWALASDLVRSLASLPGATGVSTGSARVLVGLDPSLSARFPAARHTEATGDELLRLRTAALAELVTAVAEETPLAVLVDDLHWSDGFSRRALVGLSSRAAASPVLLLTTSRSGTDGPLSERPDETIVLRPLTEPQVAEAVESLAPLPDALREPPLVTILHRATGGNPLLVLEALQGALDRGWLARSGQGWVAAELPRFLQELERESPLTRRVETVPRDERRLLLALAMAGRPLADEVVAALPLELLPGAGHALDKLEGRGLAVRSEGGRELAHDLLTDPIIAAAAAEDRQAVGEGLGLAMHATARGDPTRLLIAGQHLVRAGATAGLRAAFHDYTRARRRLHDRSSAAALAREFAGPGAGDRMVRDLVRGLPLRQRWPGSSVVAAAILVTLLVPVMAVTWRARPVEMRLELAPQFLIDSGSDRPFIVDVVDRAGRLSSRAGGTIEIAPASPDIGALRGRTVVPVKDGRAVFDSLLFFARADLPSGWSTFRFTHGELPPLVTDSVVVSSRADGLRLDSARINDQVLTRAARRIRVPRGGRILGAAHFRYLSRPSNASIILAVVPTWGDRRKIPVGTALANGVIWRPVILPLDLRAPDAPGRYRIIFVWGYETEVRFIASGTNWVYGAPRWNDGNDLAGMTEDQTRVLDSTGRITWPWLLVRHADSLIKSEDTVYRTDAALRAGEVPSAAEDWGVRELPGTTIEVDVE